MKIPPMSAVALVLIGVGRCVSAEPAPVNSAPANSASATNTPAPAKPAVVSAVPAMSEAASARLYKRMQDVAGKPLTDDQKQKLAAAEVAYNLAMQAVDKAHREAQAQALGMTVAEFHEAQIKALEKMWPGVPNAPVPGKKPEVTTTQAVPPQTPAAQ